MLIDRIEKMTTASNREQARFLLRTFWLEGETKPVLGTLWASLKNKTVCESQRADHPQ
jgi:hypothetical protein